MPDSFLTAPLLLTKVDRQRNSHDGNPNWILTFAETGSWAVKPDSTFGFEVTAAMEGKHFIVTFDGPYILDMKEVAP